MPESENKAITYSNKDYQWMLGKHIGEQDSHVILILKSNMSFTVQRSGDTTFAR